MLVTIMTEPTPAPQATPSLPPQIIKVCDGLYLGSGVHAVMAHPALCALPTRIVINCAKEYLYEPNLDLMAAHTTLPINACDPISFLENVDTAVDYIDRARARGLNTYLHGDRSQSRALAVAIYYLMMRCGKTYYEAKGQLEDVLPLAIDECLEDVLSIID